MSVLNKVAGSSVVPTLRYRDLSRAVDWLSAAFGLSPHTVTRDSDGNVVSAQLVLGNGMVMLAPVTGTVFDDLMTQPDQIDGAETQTCYFIVDDADAHYARAKEFGAQTILELQNFEQGGRGYLCRDLEGHIWSFGTFDPWQPSKSTPFTFGLYRPSRAHLGLAAAAGVGLLAAGAAFSMAWKGGDEASGGHVSPRPSAIALFKERGAKLAAQRDLAELRKVKEAADLEVDKLEEQLAHLSGAKVTADKEKSASDADNRKLADQLEKVKADHARAEKSIRRLVARGIQERRVRERSRRRAAEQLNEALVLERSAKQRSERSAQDLKAELEKAAAQRAQIEKAHALAVEALAAEKEARRKADTSLADATAELEREKAARHAAETTSPAAPAPTPAPRPAKRPDR